MGIWAIVLAIVAVAAVILLAVTGVLGGVVLVLFGDVAVFVLTLGLLVKFIKCIRKKK